jgi:hypothetical protein
MDKIPKDEMQIKNLVIIKWHTVSANFLQIEFSPTHIFRIKVDKVLKK